MKTPKKQEKKQRKEKEIERANYIRRIIYGLGFPQGGGTAYFEHIKEINKKYS